MTRRRNKQPQPGRHCILCGKPGGMGATVAIRALINQYHERDLAPPVPTNMPLHDIKAHGPCIIAARRRLA